MSSDFKKNEILYKRIQPVCGARLITANAFVGMPLSDASTNLLFEKYQEAKELEGCFVNVTDISKDKGDFKLVSCSDDSTSLIRVNRFFVAASNPSDLQYAMDILFGDGITVKCIGMQAKYNVANKKPVFRLDPSFDTISKKPLKFQSPLKLNVSELDKSTFQGSRSIAWIAPISTLSMADVSSSHGCKRLHSEGRIQSFAEFAKRRGVLSKTKSECSPESKSGPLYSHVQRGSSYPLDISATQN